MSADAPLHVTNGDWVAETIAELDLGGETLVWADVLHVGPLAFAPEQSRPLRARFLAEHGWGEASDVESQLEDRDRRLAGALGEGSVVLWFEHDLFDQLQLLQILAAAADSGSGRLELVQAETYLGSLSAAELQALWPSRTVVDDETRERAATIWRHVCEGALDTALRLDKGSLTHVHAALERLVEERTEPSRTRRQLLTALAGGPLTAGAAFAASQAEEEAAFLGDTWAFAELAGLERDGLVATVDRRRLPPLPPHGDADEFASTLLTLRERARARV